MRAPPPSDPQALAALSALDPVSARLFAARGVSDPGQLDYGLSGLAPVSLLENADAAVDLLIAKRGARITVVGDFDVDGATSAALMLRCLREFGFADVDYLVPNRFEFGYGLSPEIVRVAADDSPGARPKGRCCPSKNPSVDCPNREKKEKGRCDQAFHVGPQRVSVE